MVAGSISEMCCYQTMQNRESKRRSKDIDAKLAMDKQVKSGNVKAQEHYLDNLG